MSKDNRYNRWGEEDSPDCTFHRENYLTKSNKVLASEMGRTVDSVRKQVKKLGLKRPKKTKKRGIPKKRGRKPIPKNVFDMVEIGHLKRRKKERIKKKNAQAMERMIREKKKVDQELREEVILPCRDLSQDICVKIILDGKETVIYSQSPIRMRRYIQSLRERDIQNSKREAYGNYSAEDFI